MHIHKTIQTKRDWVSVCVYVCNRKIIIINVAAVVSACTLLTVCVNILQKRRSNEWKQHLLLFLNRTKKKT